MKKKGFTLIELLVVISIIALLSSIVLASLSTARAKARDARRMQDMHTIRTVLELYYSKNGSYPIATCYSRNTCWTSVLQLSLRDASPNLALPADPINSPGSGPWNNGQFGYYYVSNDGKVYDLITQFEDKNNPNRCELKHFKWYTGTTYLEWCPIWTPEGNYLYADH